MKYALRLFNTKSLLVLIAATSAFYIASLIAPNIGFAVFGTVDAINEWFIGLIAGLSVSLFDMSQAMINDITTDSILNRPFDTLLGSRTVHNFVVIVQNLAVLPVAGTILGFAFALHLIKMVKTYDNGNGDVATVAYQFMAAVAGFVIFSTIINNSLGFLRMIYEVVQWMIRRLLGASSTIAADPSFSLAESIVPASIHEAIVILIFSAILFLVTFICLVLAIGVGWWRAINIYVAFLLLPIGLSFLLTEQTRQWGLGALKIFISLCLALFVVIFALTLFPFIASTASMAVPTAITNIPVLGPALHDIFALINIVILLIVHIGLMLAAGRISRDALGG